MADLHMDYLKRRRAEHIREYLNAHSKWTRRNARMWARFFGQLIRKHRKEK